MAKTKISEFSSTPSNNTDIDSINIAEGCAPSGINDAIRELMAQLKDFQTGAVGDSFNGPVGSSTASTGAFTNITASGTLGVTGVATLGAGAILNTPASVTLTNATGLPISTGVSGLGTGIATALAVNTGSAGAPVLFNGALGTPSSGTVTNLTGTASININGTVGATTPTTGAFTTLSASSTVTLSGGTANGVLYLNGSKVATSGSALTFDGTNLGVGVASATAPLDVVSAASTVGAYIRGRSSDNIGSIYFTANGSTATEYGYLQGRSTDLRLYTANSNPLLFGVNGSEVGRFTSTGLGIGTSSPVAKLDVSKTATVSTTDPVGSNVPTIQGSATTTSGKAMLQLTALSSAGARSPAYIEVGAVADYRSYMNLVYSADTSGSGYFAVSQFTPVGSSTTERLRIDASGNMGLGVTPSAWATLRGLQNGRANLVGYASNAEGAWLTSNAFYDGSWKYQTSSQATHYQQLSGVHSWHNAPSGTAGNAITFTQAMTLAAGGQLGIGNTIPATLDGNNGSGTLVVGSGSGSNGMTIYSGSSSGNEARLTFANSSSGSGAYAAQISYKSGDAAILFYNGNAERARIDLSGNLLINLTSASGRSGKVCIDGVPDSAVSIDSLQNASTSQAHIYFRNSNGLVGSIATSGSATAYNTTSDQRLKENIVDAPEFGTVIDAIKVRSYDWKSEGSHQRAGFIAQELVTVAPEAVHQPADPEEMMAVDYSKLVPMLVKEIQSLRKRLADAGIA